MTSPTWGDTVRVKLYAKPELRPGVLAAVCGLRSIETDEQARQFDCPIGTTLYLVEFGDGVSFEVPSTIVDLVEVDSLAGNTGG